MPRQGSPQLSLGYPYAAAMGLALLILLAERKVRRREGELLEAVRKRDKSLEFSVEEQLRLQHELASHPGLPTDTLGVVTEQGVLCSAGLDHPAGSRPDDCTGCVLWNEHAPERKSPDAPDPQA